MKRFIIEHPIAAGLSLVAFLVLSFAAVFTYLAWSLLREMRKDRQYD